MQSTLELYFYTREQKGKKQQHKINLQIVIKSLSRTVCNEKRKKTKE